LRISVKRGGAGAQIGVRQRGRDRRGPPRAPSGLGQRAFFASQRLRSLHTAMAATVSKAITIATSIPTSTSVDEMTRQPQSLGKSEAQTPKVATRKATQIPTPVMRTSNKRARVALSFLTRELGKEATDRLRKSLVRLHVPESPRSEEDARPHHGGNIRSDKAWRGTPASNPLDHRSSDK
jgi:hypothetical protein